jgi:hypothetical protein
LPVLIVTSKPFAVAVVEETAAPPATAMPPSVFADHLPQISLGV